MTEPPAATRHLLRPSVPDTVPPLPGGVGIALGFLQGEGDDECARLYVRERPGSSAEVRQLDGVRAGDRFDLGRVRIGVIAFQGDAVLLSAEVRADA